ncbi:MAG: hypothetical protein WCO60_14580 [Verrucomicrobiota bacterium]
MFRLFRVLAILAAVQLLGGHWVVLQTAAWVSMTVEYAKTDSIPEAIAKTLDGQHPCKLCHAVKKARTDEQEQTQVKIALKSEAILPEVITLPSPSFHSFEFPASGCSTTTRTLAPPTPPPLA